MVVLAFAWSSGGISNFYEVPVLVDVDFDVEENPKTFEKHTGVSKNRGAPNAWFIMENPIKNG